MFSLPASGSKSPFPANSNTPSADSKPVAAMISAPAVPEALLPPFADDPFEQFANSFASTSTQMDNSSHIKSDSAGTASFIAPIREDGNSSEMPAVTKDI